MKKKKFQRNKSGIEKNQYICFNANPLQKLTIYLSVGKNENKITNQSKPIMQLDEWRCLFVFLTTNI